MPQVSNKQATEATAGNERVTVLNDPAAGHGVSQPILQSLQVADIQSAPGGGAREIPTMDADAVRVYYHQDNS